MRTTTAFFAGAGTIVVALAMGLGGGMLISNIVSPHLPKEGAELSKMERRTTEPTSVSNAPSEPVSYRDATQAAAIKPVTVSPAPQAQAEEAQPLQAQSQTQQAQPPAQQANAAPSPAVQPSAKPADPQPARNVNSTSQQPASNSQSTPSTQTAAREPSASSDEALAKARDADVKRAVRRAEERRKAERRERWAERRRYRGRGDDELRDVELKVREETESPRVFAAEPARIEMPRIRLFGDDD